MYSFNPYNQGLTFLAPSLESVFMGDPTGSYAPTSITLPVLRAHRTLHIKVETKRIDYT
jgi:hypothetical protein